MTVEESQATQLNLVQPQPSSEQIHPKAAAAAAATRARMAEIMGPSRRQSVVSYKKKTVEREVRDDGKEDMEMGGVGEEGM